MNVSLEAAILELASAIRALAESSPKTVAAAPAVAPARRTKTEKEPTVEKAGEKVADAPSTLRTTTVSQEEIDEAARQTEANRKAKEEAAAASEAAAATAKAAAKSAEKPAPQVDPGLRQVVRDLIYKIDAERGRPAAVAVLKSVGVLKVSEAADDVLPAIKAAAEKALEPATEDIG